MNLHADLTLRVVGHVHEARWLPSPNPAVQRRMLDRIGDEVARATTIVRYAAGAKFDRHCHGGGEEILVLEGVFSDEQGDHPACTYLRNPPGSAHAPFSVEGCLLFVKLWQFAADDLIPLRIDTAAMPWQLSQLDGVEMQSLHRHRQITTTLERWAPGVQRVISLETGGVEILVLTGGFCEHAEYRGDIAINDYTAGSWLRVPCGCALVLRAGSVGTTVYVKVGHLGAASSFPT